LTNKKTKHLKIQILLNNILVLKKNQIVNLYNFNKKLITKGKNTYKILLLLSYTSTYF